MIIFEIQYNKLSINDTPMFMDFLLKYYFKSPKDFMVFLGGKLQPDATVATVYAKILWRNEPFKIRLKSILNRNYFPDNEKIQKAAHRVFIHDIFGGESDYGDKILKLRMWHEAREWHTDSLTPLDKAKASGLQNLSVLTRTIFRDKYSPFLNLNLGVRVPFMCCLIHPMIAKIPIISIRNYLDVQASFAFNSIRHSLHPKSDDLISYLYDILLIQQKIANSLHEYLKQLNHVELKKNKATLMNSEMIAIMGADLVFTYLKASVEKTIVLIAYIYEIPNIENRKTHKQRLAALVTGVPEKIQRLPYFEFVYEFIKSENLEELNSYRSGLLHKKGISDLQPHNYVGKDAEEIPLRKVYDILIEQHATNTAVLLGALALLTDDLVSRDPPDISPFDIPR